MNTNSVIRPDRRLSHLEAAHISSHVYTETEDLADLVPGLELIKQQTVEESGFKAIIYRAYTRNLVVVSFRGTTDVAALVEDVRGVYLGQVDTPQKELAFIVTNAAMTSAVAARAQMIFTGHSLGGYLAELSVFFVHTVLAGQAAPTKDFDVRHHVSAVTFESPGSLNSMQRLLSSFVPHERVAVEELDITCYVSYPNIVNTCNGHVGTLYHIAPPVPPPSWGRLITLADLSAKHSMSGIVALLQGGGDRVYMKSWPCGVQSSNEYYAVMKHDYDSGTYTMTETKLADGAMLFKMAVAGSMLSCEEMSSARSLPLRHFTVPFRVWLVRLYALLAQIPDAELHQLQTQAPWKDRFIGARGVLQYVTAGCLIQPNSLVDAVFIQLDDTVHSAEEFRKILSDWLFMNKGYATALLEDLEKVISAGKAGSAGVPSIRAVSLESEALVEAAAVIDTVKAHGVQIARELAEAASHTIQDVHQAGVGLVAGLENGAAGELRALADRIGAIDVSSINLRINI